MRKLSFFAAAIIIVLLIGGVASRAFLQQQSSTNADRPVFTSTYTLEDTKAYDLFVLAETAHLTTTSHVAADVAIVGRTSVTVDGQVDGELTVMGGDITLGKGSWIAGKASLIGSKITLLGRIDGQLDVVADTLTIDPAAQIQGALDICATHLNNELSGTLQLRQCAADELAGWQSLRDGTLVQKAITGQGFSVGGFVATGLVALALAALAGLVVTIFPRPFSYMTQAIRTMPTRMARVGCFSQLLIAAAVALLIVLIGLIPPVGLVAMPVVALILLPVGLLFVIGWMTMALLSGDWLLRRFARRANPPMLTMIAGSLGLFVLWTLLAILPYGPLVSACMLVILGAVGFGAAVITRVGRRSPVPSYFVQG